MSNAAPGCRVLVVYPHNFFLRRMGIDSRYYQLMHYFKERQIAVDLFSLENFAGSWAGQDPSREDLIDRLFLYDFSRDRLARKMRGRLGKNLPDYVSGGMRKAFHKIVSAADYDFVLVSYVYWASLLQSAPLKGAQTILDVSDFSTLKLFQLSPKRIATGRALEEEIGRINRFDQVLCISEEERWFFSLFAPRPRFSLIPHFAAGQERSSRAEPEYELVYIASDNPFNRQGAGWFFGQVYPLLSPPPRILAVGAITAHLPQAIEREKNIDLLPFAPDLGQVYPRARVSICPLLAGTGLKIKVVESLSYQVPVVTTPRGVDGFADKNGNGCLVGQTPAEFAGHIGRLLGDKEFYRARCLEAAAYFSSHFERSLIYRRLDGIFKKVEKMSKLG